MFWWSCFVATLHFYMLLFISLCNFYIFSCSKSQCYTYMSCRYNVSTNIIFSHLSKVQASRLTCINRCKDLSLNPINNNLIVLNWIGNARPCMFVRSDWFWEKETKDINIDEPHIIVNKMYTLLILCCFWTCVKEVHLQF